MGEKNRNRLCQAANSVILAGLIVFFTGLYYWMIKAGIPYQDAPWELQLTYTIHMRIGEILLGKGFVIAAAGGLARLLLGLMYRGGRSRI